MDFTIGSCVESNARISNARRLARSGSTRGSLEFRERNWLLEVARNLVAVHIFNPFSLERALSTLLRPESQLTRNVFKRLNSRVENVASTRYGEASFVSSRSTATRKLHTCVRKCLNICRNFWWIFHDASRKMIGRFIKESTRHNCYVTIVIV